MSVSSKYQWKCDWCDTTQYTALRKLPKSWEFTHITGKFVTGHGYTVNETKSYHFCTTKCKEYFLSELE